MQTRETGQDTCQGHLDLMTEGKGPYLDGHLTVAFKVCTV